MSDPMIEKPAFLVGSVRSGTTLLRIMLDRHPSLSFFHEFEYSIDLVGDDGKFPDLKGYYDYLSGHRIFQDSHVSIDRDLDYKSLVNHFLEQKRDRDRKPLVGATIHSHFDRLLWIWPDARFIHLVRDGRDVARSMVEIGFEGSTYSGIEKWIEVERLWADLALMLPPERRIEIRYEELVAKPEETLTRICDFLGIPFDLAMLDYPKDSTYGPPSKTFSERWRKMPAEEVDLMEAKAAGMLIHRGYPLSGRPLRQITPALHKQLITKHRLARARFRMKRYGAPLYLSEVVARRLHLNPIQRKLNDKINEVDRLHLK
ncbi:sulfotransferase family protein [Tundrisphaera lichenicola]|uniref:sulfotransferase family protein n=1 Tax=Tundrisphaera lichenicola TaxID=2029860 RepID=UPI003EB92F38